MTAATAADPLARRDELEAEIERVREAEARHDVRIDEILADLEKAKGDLWAASEEAARSGDDRESQALHRKIADLESELPVVREARDGATRARDKAHETLTLLLREHFEVFAEQCEAKTQEAIAQLRAIEDGYSEAEEAWAEAVRSWQPLVDAAEGAGRPEATMDRAPDWPLLYSRVLYKRLGSGDLVPRPREITVSSEHPVREHPVQGIQGIRIEDA